MNATRKSARYVRFLLLLAAIWISPLTAFAQAAEEEKAPKSYVPGYALTVLSVGLGIFVVVRPGKRKFPKIRRKEDEDEDIKPKH